MEALKNRYFSLNSAINRDLQDLNGLEISYLKSFRRRHIFVHRSKLQSHMETFEKLDTEYRSNLNTNGTLQDLLLKNAKVSVLEKARSLPNCALSEYQKTISGSEACINFNVTTAIALIALVLSFISTVT